MDFFVSIKVLMETDLHVSHKGETTKEKMNKHCQQKNNCCNDDANDDDDDSGKDEASAEELAAPPSADTATNVDAAAEGEGAEEGGLGGKGTATAPTATSIIEQCIVDWESKVRRAGRGGSGSPNV